MVDRTLISQLQSMNAGQRREAIMALGRTKDRDAIPHLSRVAENDPDPDLRELARKAAIYIDKNAPVVSVKPFKMPWDDDESEADERDAQPMSAAAAAVLTDYTPPTPEQVSETQDREWAERFIERAWQAHYTGDKEGAEMYLRKAFERAPKIVELDSAREAAGKIMGMNPDRAVAALLKPKTMRRPGSMTRTTGSIKVVADKAAAAPKKEKTVDEIEDGSAGTLFFDLFVFFVLLFLFNFGVLLLVVTLIGAQAAAAQISPNDISGTYTIPIFQRMYEEGAGTVALYAAIGALATIVQTLFLWFIMHVVATTLLGGNSTFPRLVRKTYLFYALSTPVIIILFIVAFLMAAILNDTTVLQAALAVAILGSIFLLAWRIGVAYRFDFARGCFTLILTQVALVCCSATITLALIAAGVGPFAALADQLARR